jgi:hypothetical protein
MSKPFYMELFLASMLTGSHATRQRHLRQASTIQAKISKRWHRQTPRTWREACGLVSSASPKSTLGRGALLLSAERSTGRSRLKKHGTSTSE